MLVFNRMVALSLLSECTGDDIWSVQHCQTRGVPAIWLEELQDCFESSFESDDQTIYVQDQATNQYEGIRDVDLAIKLGSYLGVSVSDLISRSPTRRSLVQAIREVVEEG